MIEPLPTSRSAMVRMRKMRVIVINNTRRDRMLAI